MDKMLSREELDNEFLETIKKNGVEYGCLFDILGALGWRDCESVVSVLSSDGNRNLSSLQKHWL